MQSIEEIGLADVVAGLLHVNRRVAGLRHNLQSRSRCAEAVRHCLLQVRKLLLLLCLLGAALLPKGLPRRQLPLQLGPLFLYHFMIPPRAPSEVPW